MQVNKVLKSLAVALPMFTLAACSSSDSSTDSTGTETNTGSQTTVVTPVDGGQGGLTEQEIRNNELRQSQTVYFSFDDYSVLPQFEDMLDAHAEFLRANADIKVVVEGHADERGTPEYNIALGERRANAVAKYLQALGVPSSQISIVSYGEEKPLVLGQGEDAYSKNRRAVLVY
ncbi:peptidoglycan-associated lipoprotein Pal [Grimontia hollisae]|uniref:Peptidoglycan-associated lipoprotein n=2 Tax=Grimontia hollisae TaxID=673 RepID=D0IBF8_GRIHO|nr:peptidoglycan-associated lipoprotein Pal [Grimontia hollisae]AMG29612.1 peptidoglycan-associated lipoprotein Pal [Grimontia hollisae]EEY71226.1 peptidoglycan-associated outer membrane lipoprotein [Grimontia hollisae CIP 101886]MDF2186547.1 peptidoglycan-associated lipoprotein Pal [Grimontia hollisae]STO43810.1 Peptidoglycan-associated lipoprotein precursor [Grimontia hollisae]STO57102.1 Peptidoglycan-associated lipoprotein precursor [Grimontia hollisae]